MRVSTFTAPKNVYKNLMNGCIGACTPEEVELVQTGNKDPTDIAFDDYVKRCVRFLSDFKDVADGAINNSCNFHQ